MTAVINGLKTADRLYNMALRGVVMGLAGVSGLSVLAMILVTCVDVFARAIGHSLTGSFDVVRIAGALAVACALPYTTAVKGHVAVEYFFQKLGRRGRVVVDTLSRALIMLLLAIIAWQFFKYGQTLRRTGEVSLTLQIPMFWVADVIAVTLAVTVLVKIHNLLHPGREMIKP